MDFITFFREYSRRSTKLKKNLSKIQVGAVNLDGESFDVFIDYDEKSVVFESKLDGGKITFNKNDTMRRRVVNITTGDDQPASKSFRMVQEAYDLVTSLRMDSKI